MINLQWPQPQKFDTKGVTTTLHYYRNLVIMTEAAMVLATEQPLRLGLNYTNKSTPASKTKSSSTLPLRHFDLLNLTRPRKLRENPSFEVCKRSPPPPHTLTIAKGPDKDHTGRAFAPLLPHVCIFKFQPEKLAERLCTARGQRQTWVLTPAKQDKLEARAKAEG